MNKNKKIIYTLHQTGSESHFLGLKYLCDKNSFKLIYRELNLAFQLYKSIRLFNFNKLCKFFVNIYFLASLFFSKNRIIVLGLAPYHYSLYFLNMALKNHNVFYFTSYTCWDQSKMAESTFFSENLLDLWRKFLKCEVKYIFAVTKIARSGLVRNNFSDISKIKVVAHSYNFDIKNKKPKSKQLKFIYAGRLDHNKGIVEILNIFKNLNFCELNIIGDGPLRNVVVTHSEDFNNINYFGYVRSSNILKYFKNNSFLILNSKKSKKWEELFGMVIIEGMACGVVPITTDHSGPTEIISNLKDGIICKENNIEFGIKKAIKMSEKEFQKFRKNAIIKSKDFHVSKIYKRWEKVLSKTLN